MKKSPSMKKSLSAILCVTLVGVIVFSLVACNSKNTGTDPIDPSYTSPLTEADSNQETIAPTLGGIPNSEETVSTTTTPAVAESDATTSAAEQPIATTTAVVTTTRNQAQNVVPVGSNISSILAYYNKNANAVKNSTSKVTIKKRDKRDTTMDIPKILEALAGKETLEKQLSEQLGDNPNTDETKTLSFSGGKSGNTSLAAFVPVSGKNYVSNLTVANISSATCSQSGSETTLTINIKDEPFSMENQAKMYPLYMDVGFGVENSSGGGSMASGNNGIAGTAISLTGSFSGGQIIAKFDANNRLKSLNLKYTANVTISLIKLAKIKVAQNALQELTLSW